MQHQVALLVESDGMSAQELDPLVSPDLGQTRRDGLRVDFIRQGALQTQNDRRVGAVTAAGGAQGTV